MTVWKDNGGSPGGGFLLGGPLGLLAVLILAVATPQAKEIERARAIPGPGSMPPTARNPAKSQARVCRYCGT
jgi:hypothetical protein